MVSRGWGGYYHAGRPCLLLPGCWLPNFATGISDRQLAFLSYRHVSVGRFACCPRPRSPRLASRRRRLSTSCCSATLSIASWALVGTVHAAGRKSFGLLVADPTTPQCPYCATDVVFFDPAKNRRNDPAFRPAFQAQGSYCRSYDDAGLRCRSGRRTSPTSTTACTT